MNTEFREMRNRLPIWFEIGFEFRFRTLVVTPGQTPRFMPVTAVPFNLFDESWAINKICRRGAVVDKPEVAEKEDQRPEVQPKAIDLFKSWDGCIKSDF